MKEIPVKEYHRIEKREQEEEAALKEYKASDKKYFNQMRLGITIEYICIFVLLFKDVIRRLTEDRELDLIPGIAFYVVMVVLYIFLAVRYMYWDNYRKRKSVMIVYRRIMIKLAVIAFFCIMSPNFLGFCMSWIVYLFSGFEYRVMLSIWVFELPVIVKVCISVLIGIGDIALVYFSFNQLASQLYKWNAYNTDWTLPYVTPEEPEELKKLRLKAEQRRYNESVARARMQAAVDAEERALRDANAQRQKYEADKAISELYRNREYWDRQELLRQQQELINLQKRNS